MDEQQGSSLLLSGVWSVVWKLLEECEDEPSEALQGYASHRCFVTYLIYYSPA